MSLTKGTCWEGLRKRPFSVCKTDYENSLMFQVFPFSIFSGIMTV